MPANELRLLALDGGGVRGLSALMILEQLMETVNPGSPPKPCEYFDMIGGTSTGGKLIAVMLGRLRMSVDDCITEYLRLSDRVFRRTRHRVTVKGKVQGRFDSEELERAVKEVVQKQGLSEDALLKDASESGCKVFVCATSKETSKTVCLTSYRTPRGNNDLLNSTKIWEACRATSAASSFFDPIAVGRYKEEFIDGATGANNPVRDVWDQAQLVWGPAALEGQIKRLVSIGTGVPSLKPFKDDVFHIGTTLVAIATETEQTAERFRRERSMLADAGQYYRFNVAHGLEEIGLEESKKIKEIAAATRDYVGSEDVYKQMQACAGSIAGRSYFGVYRTLFSLEGVPRVSQFVDRPAEMAKMEQVLLPGPTQTRRQKIHVLHGLGGIGKTQLAVEFARRHHPLFSSVWWLDGRSESSVKRSIASHASKIPSGQIPETSRTYAADSGADVNAVVKDVMNWLAQPDNTAWLLIFDNVDREYNPQGGDPDAYDVRRYLSGADHGSVLVTTRLARLEQLGKSQPLGKVDKEQAQAILKNWYKRKHDTSEVNRLLELLDGLPLAIAQAGAYLQESGVGLTAYLKFYEQQWSELMESKLSDDAPLQDYPNRSIWTTWAISYQAIRSKHEATANLLLLWSFLDNKDLWHGLFAEAYNYSAVAARLLSEWIGGIASSELEFGQAMQLLRNYSLVEEVQDTTSYATHPVVHQWAYHSQGKFYATELSQLAIVTVGLAVPDLSAPNYTATQRRLLPHAQVCTTWVVESETRWCFVGSNDYDKGLNKGNQHEIVLGAIHLLGNLYADQGKLDEAEQMYERALRGTEEALGPKHTSTLDTVNNLGLLYADQGKLSEAEQMYERALRGTEEALGPKHTSTLQTVNNLGSLYYSQGKLSEAEQMYERALRGKEEALGPKHTSTLETVNNLGGLYYNQGKLGKAEQMYERALRGYKEALSDETLQTYKPALNVLQNLGILYAKQGGSEKARAMYSKALGGYQALLGPSHSECLQLAVEIDNLRESQQGKQNGFELMTKPATTKVRGSKERKRWRIAVRRIVDKIIQ
ncbi:hypothetical protein BKA66DRAFT_423213 [Pyrenochaeta sp. MPI-SDFR-AT-0127]|nr:hypothetical protein BKA66DRAFT_423213 [Pyrenochaeta sp. MPI-SDFR-AT-0127]